MTSYQKLKLENQQLIAGIYNLIENPESIDSIHFKFHWKLRIDTERAIWGFPSPNVPIYHESERTNP